VVSVGGRIDFTINTAGRKVAPEAIEEVLEMHPRVAGAIALAAPDPSLGEVPVALIEPAVETAADDALVEDILSFAAERLSRWKVPRALHFIDKLPRSPMGKPLRAAAAAIRQKIELGESLQKGLGDRATAVGRGVDEGMLHQNGGPRDAVGAGDAITKADGTTAEALDLKGDMQTVADTHGSGEIALDMHQGHDKEAIGENLLEVAEGGGQHLLEGGVAVLEKTPEKGDAGAVDFIKTNGERMLEGHQHNPFTPQESSNKVLGESTPAQHSKEKIL